MFGENETVCILNLDLEDVELFEDVFRDYLSNMQLQPEEMEPVLEWWRYFKDKCCKSEIGYKIKDLEED